MLANGETHLDNLALFKHKALTLLKNSQRVIALIANDNDIDIDSPLAYDTGESGIYDHDFIDETVQMSDAAIMVEAEMVKAPSGTTFTVYLYVQVICSKSYIALDRGEFPGTIGNRMDNLIEQCDLVLNGKLGFGAGRLMAKSVMLAAVPQKFTSKLITYQISDFSSKPELWSDVAV